MAANAERDTGLNILNLKTDYSLANGESYIMREPTYGMPRRPGRWQTWVNSFRRDPHGRMTPKNAFTANPDWPSMFGGGRDDEEAAEGTRDHMGLGYYDLRAANYRTAHSLLARELKGRHLQMIAIGGSIVWVTLCSFQCWLKSPARTLCSCWIRFRPTDDGFDGLLGTGTDLGMKNYLCTGLFISSGTALNTGGPASVLLAYMIIGVMLYCVMQALGELAVVFPIAGSFSAYSTRFLDPAWGFAMGWNYALQWLIVLPLEIIAASITISYWNAGLNKAIFVTAFLAIIIGINLCGVKGYGEAEFIFAIIKVAAVIGFILLGIVINIGGAPDGGYIGGKYWHSPGAFNNGFKGLCSVFVTAAFAFAGTEMVGLAAAETANPRKSLPTAIKQVFWRISLFYILALTLIGLLVPYDDNRLLGSKSVTDSSASPFVLAIQDAGIQVLPSVMNVVILVAVMSVGNSAVFGSSRTLAALADQGQAPALLSYVDRRGRPLMAILCASVVGFLAYLADLPQEGDVLNWLLAISALSSVFTWASICIAHIRFRKCWRLRGRSPDELAFRAQAGVLGSWVGLVLNVLILVAQFWTGAWPVGYSGQSARDNVQNFFLNYTAAPVVAIMYVGYKVLYRTRIVRMADMDVNTGRRDFNLPILMEQEMEEKRSRPKWKKLYKFFC